MQPSMRTAPTGTGSEGGRGSIPALLRWLVAGLAVLGAGCASPTKPFLNSTVAPTAAGEARVLVMPPDIELSELTAAGLMEPNAAWTSVARNNVDLALGNLLNGRSAKTVAYRTAQSASTYEDAHVQVVKLHGAVGNMILMHKYVPNLELPTKKDKFDWSLGDGVAALRTSYDADYALFIYLRDSFASSGRVALIFVGALLGVGVPGGVQVGFASLVDLRSGDIVWFNRLARAEGDLRKPDMARDAVDRLLTDIPL